MANKTINDILDNIESKNILLPAMQRKFVWSEAQILQLFDSIMKGYPFGMMVFWKIKDRKEIKKYQFYEFIKNYSARDQSINVQAGVSGKSTIDLVMDGQQRLTALYIGVMGSLETIGKNKKKRVAENWKKKKLYIRPYIAPDLRGDDDEEFAFEFLDKDSVKSWNDQHSEKEQYYHVADFYGMTEEDFEETWTDESWCKPLAILRQRLNDDEIINYHVIENTDIVDVLEIFKRINNGGTKLSPANLLFSTVITSWEEGREEMDEFISSINKEDVLHLKEDFLIRTCAYLMNQPSAVKIETLTTAVILSIKNNWTKIKAAVTATKNFLKDLNISHNVILSYNSIMPIIYYFYHFGGADIGDTARKELFKFFVVSQLFGLFGGSSAGALDAVRKAMCKYGRLGELKLPFTLKSLFNIDLSAGRINAFKIERDEIVKLVDTTYYGNKKAYILLCLLQPGVRLKAMGDYLDIDHVCSKKQLKGFTRYKKTGEKSRVDSIKNGLPNLQLLDYAQNRGDKKADSLYEWVVEKENHIPFDPFTSEADSEKRKALYQLKDIAAFETFYEKRRKLMIDKLCDLLK